MKGKKSFAARLRELSRQHYKRALSLDEYRQKRRDVLDTIDEYFNGVVTSTAASAHEKREDATVPYRLEDKSKG